MTKKENLAWAAGFFDGEGSSGCYRVGKYETFYLRLSIAQNDRKVLDKFQKTVGLGSVLGPYNGKGNSHPYYSFQVQSVELVKQVMDLIWPWLGVAKKEQFRIALDLYHSKQKLKKPLICFSAYGVSQSITDWIKDPRCAVGYKSLYSRIIRGWDPEEALTTPPLKQIKSQ